jgi:phosphoribosylformylglycinamidine cyclo-ligase
MRAPLPLSYVIARVPEVPAVLELVCRTAGMSAHEAYGTFNMGAGFACFVAAPDAARAVQVAAGAGFALLAAGQVVAGPRRVLIEPLGLTFEGDSLQIR